MAPTLTTRRTSGRSLLVALLGLLVVGTGVLGPASVAQAATGASTSSNPARTGLYGSQDPTYDGVYRQSLALLALVAAGVTPDPRAVSWLLDQQCGDGGFEAFRSDLTAPCSPPDSTTYSGEDANSTGAAAQALVALGRSAEAAQARAWLAAHQSPDGGWSYYPDGTAGNASDANSTALAAMAFSAAGATPPTTGGQGPVQALLGLQVGCSGDPADRGAFTFFGSPNDYATVQAALAIGGGALPVAPSAPADDAPVLACPGGATDAPTAAAAAAGYLARVITANGGAVPDPSGSGADLGSTANAVLALVATGHGATAVQAALGVLAADQAGFTHTSGADVPGALALLTLAAVAGGQDPSSFGGTDLVTRLEATLTQPATSTPSPTPTTPSPTPTTSRSSPASSPAVAGSAATLPDTGSGATRTALAGGLLVLAGAGLVGWSRGRRVR